jgi:macrolide-specific efflux system membrane fusion protein
MANTGHVEAPETPVDLTEELPLDDENILPPEPPSAWRRYRWPIIGAAVVIVAAAIALPLWLTSGSSTAGGLSITTVTVPVTTGTIQQTVTSSGTIEPASQANLNFAVSGVVTGVNVKAGQTVTAGQVLATVDTTALNEDLNAAQAQLTSAQDKLASDEDSSASTSQIDSDESSVTSAESSLSTAQTNLNDASLTSTIAGTVASVDLTVGQQVTGTGSGSTGSTGSSGATGATGASGATGSSTPSSSSSSTGTASTSGQIVVIGTDSYIVNTTVDDTQIGQISDGDQVDISLSGSTSSTGGTAAAGGAFGAAAATGGSSTAASASSTAYGTVGSISLIGSQSSDVTTFPVVVDVTGNPSGLYAGATADVSIIVKQLSDVTEVPTNAISYTSGGQATVTEVANGNHVVTNVTVGEAENGETQILSGVKSGDKVLEREVSFKAPGGGSAGLFGGTGTRTGGFGGAGGFPGGGGGFTGGGGGFTGAG